MSGRIVVIQASSSEDDSMPSPTAAGDEVVEPCLDESLRGTKSENKNIYRYDRETMLKLYNHPLAQTRPSVLSPEFDMEVENDDGGNGDSAGGNKLWNPERWINNIWNPDSRDGNSGHGGSASHNRTSRRQGDHDGVKKKQIDRLKTENEDGIVLSPQRRSFGAGCQVASFSANGNGSGSHGGSASINSTVQQPRRSASPLVGDDRSQQAASHTNSRASFRSRGAASVAGAASQQVPVPNQGQSAAGAVGSFHQGHGRGDRSENWRERSGYGGSGYGRNSGKEAPASIVTYSRSRGGNPNSWHTGGNRRSYGNSGGYQHHHSDNLPEWVTEGPADMFETMELRGFDEEERQQLRKESTSGIGTRRGGGRQEQYRSSVSGEETKVEKHTSSGKTTGRREETQEKKRDSIAQSQQKPSTQNPDTDKFGKMAAETLVDGFDIGDMAQFLSVAGAGFDSIANGELPPDGKVASLPGNAVRTPGTPTAASRFSKFFASGGSSSATASEKTDQRSPQKPQQQSVNIMEFLSKAAGSSGAKAPAAGGVTIPAGAKSVEEIEAAYKLANSAQKAGGSSNKDLFQSACSADPINELKPNLQDDQADQKLRNAIYARQHQNTNAANEDSQLAMDQQQRLPENAAGGTVTKGNPLADPAQQQQFMDALRKLHLQQQIHTPSQQHSDMVHRQAGNFGSMDASNAFMAGYPQLGGLQQFLQHQAMQMGSLQAMNNGGRIPSPLGLVAGGVQIPHQHVASTSAQSAQAVNPAFAGFMPPPNVPPPPITQQDLLLAHTQAVYQRALMNRKVQQNVDESAVAKACAQNASNAGKLPTAFLPTSVIKQMHGGVKAKEASEEAAVGGARPIVKQQQLVSAAQQEQISPSSSNDNSRTASAKAGPSVSSASVAPPPPLTPQDLQRLIEQTHLQQRQQRQQQERVLLEQYAKSQQQSMPPSSAATANAVSAALALQNNPMFVQMLRAHAMQQAQQLAVLQQQAAAAAAAGTNLLPQQPPIPASAAVSAIPNSAQMVRPRLGAPPAVPPTVASNPELMRHVLQQQHQQLLFNQLRQQVPADANLLLNRLLTGQATQQNPMYQLSAAASLPPRSLGVQQVAVDAKPITVEELERLHKQAAAMQQPQ